MSSPRRSSSSETRRPTSRSATLKQISEATLSFVPKVVAAVLVLAFAGPWMMTTLVEYLQRTLQSIPAAIG